MFQEGHRNLFKNELFPQLTKKYLHEQDRSYVLNLAREVWHPGFNIKYTYCNKTVAGFGDHGVEQLLSMFVLDFRSNPKCRAVLP